MPKTAKKPAVADSWEDEDLSDNAPEDPTPPPQPSASTPSPPLQSSSAATLSDTEHSHDWDTRSAGAQLLSASSNDPDSAKRPEKTDAVARRMIAASLGLKAPKQTEEQKAYQKSIKEQERKRREKEKEEEKRQHELTEKAKAAIWDD